MNKYDRLIKENFFTELLPVIEFLLGLPSIKKTTAIAGKLQHTLEKEPDYARIVELENGEKFILHLEFQIADEKNMIYRMRHYHILRSWPVCRDCVTWPRMSPNSLKPWH